MKTYEVEFRRTSFITVSVRAKDAEDAEELAWHEVEDNDDANWDIESVEETVGGSDES